MTNQTEKLCLVDHGGSPCTCPGFNGNPKTDQTEEKKPETMEERFDEAFPELYVVDLQVQENIFKQRNALKSFIAEEIKKAEERGRQYGLNQAYSSIGNIISAKDVAKSQPN